MHEKNLTSRLEDVITGRVITPGAEDYDVGRRVFYPFFDRRPAVIVRPADAQDVSRVVSVAAETGLALSVQLDPESPEGTVQEYLLAISEERWDEAIEVVHEDWRGACDGSDIQVFSQGDFTAELGTAGGFGGSTSEERFFDHDGAPAPAPDETTDVEVTIHHRDQGGLGTGWDENVVFELVDEDDFWWLVGDPWPYFVWNCTDR